MFFSVEILDLFLYCVQQLGVMLAVGAETIVLIAYIVSMRDGKVDETEVRFSRAVHRALLVGLACIVLSGLAIVWLHFLLQEQSTVLEPVFLFKWLLILALILIYTWQKGKPFSHFLIEGVVGGTWYALFLVHILAPQTSWGNLITIYVVLVGGFVAAWSTLVSVSKKHPQEKVVQKPITLPPKAPAAPSIPKLAPAAPPVVHAMPPLVPKPVAPVPIVLKVEVPKAPAPPPVSHPEPHHSHWLPAIHVMPQNEKQLEDKTHITPLGSINKPA